MNKFKFYFILLITTITLFSCSKNDDDEAAEPIRDFQTQYDVEIKDIEDYLRENTISWKNAPGQTSDQDVVISKITDAATQPSIMSYKSNATTGSTVFPQLWSKEVKLHDITYKLYYLILRKGVGKSPCNVDGVFASYKGTYLSRSSATATPALTFTSTTFEEVVHPREFSNLYSLITGWGEAFPQFKTGTSTINSNGTVTYNDFGAGVMFLPSGLGYYSSGSSSIPAYSPLVFSFKLYEIQRNDQDNDGIPSHLEDLNNDGYVQVLATGVTNIDDTDGDFIPDFLDIDDDGDKYTTKLETQYIHPLDLDKTIRYYPYDGVLVDDPTTPFVDERQGIPSYSATGSPDHTSPTRSRIHLDKEHHTAKP
jgi:hypothetical protein